MKARLMTSLARWIFAAGLFLGLFLPATMARAAEGILDYDRFMREIEPLITTTTYASPTAGTTCLSCHGVPATVAYSTFPLVLGDHRANFQTAASRVNFLTPDLSVLLLKPLAINAGGLPHGLSGNNGGEQFPNLQDTRYRAILRWIIDARANASGARISKTLPYPNPFRSHVDIVYFLTTAAHEVTVTVYRQDGSTLRTFEGTTNVGANRVRWNGRDTENEPSATGLYFYVVKASFDDGTNTAKGTIVYTP